MNYEKKKRHCRHIGAVACIMLAQTQAVGIKETTEIQNVFACMVSESSVTAPADSLHCACCLKTTIFCQFSRVQDKNVSFKKVFLKHFSFLVVRTKVPTLFFFFEID